MGIIKKIAAFALACTLAAGTVSVYAQNGTTPGYKMINSYDEDNGIITCSIYVTDGLGSVGQLGIYYDTELLDIAATVDNNLTADYEIADCKLKNFVSSVEPVEATQETNHQLENLINEQKGEIFFAWYTGVGKYADATSSDAHILTIKFIVADGVDANELEEAGAELITFADTTPSNKDVVGYNSGVLITNELNEYFRNKKSQKEYRINLSVEYEGLDIGETETITITVVDKDGAPVEGAYVKIGSKEVQTNAEGKAAFEVSGEYVVYYKNSKADNYAALEFGETNAKITAPSKPTITNITKNSEKLTVYWSKPESTGGSNITGYVVSYTKDGESEITKEVDGSTTKLVLQGLSSETEYTVKVKAVNAIGDGEYSDEMKATTTKPSSQAPQGGGAPAPTENTFVVNYDVGENGTIVSGSKSEKVESGKKPLKVPTVKANDGYEFIGWARVGTQIIDPKTVTITTATTFTAQYKKLIPDNPFTDVAEGDWYYSYVMSAYADKLMNGVSETVFDPNGDVTRAMFVTVLYRMEGSPENAGNVKFSDIEAGSWYDKAVAWASANQIVNGVSDTEFAPNNKITREQMAAMVYRYANYKKADMTVAADIASYTDYANVSAYAVEPMKWVCGMGIINGMTDTTLVPQGTSTRAQAATVFVRTLDALSK